MGLKIDSYLLALLLGDNPEAVAKVLMDWAGAYAQGEPSEERMIDWINEGPRHQHPYFAADNIAKFAGGILTFGGQHIPDFLRELAAKVEDEHRRQIRRLVVERGPAAIVGMGEKFSQYASEHST